MDEPTNVSDEAVLAYNRARVESLLQMVVAALPTAKACMSADGSFGYVSASIEFSNGISVLVACDNDLPQALFEVVRFSSPQQPPLLAFEARATLGAAFSDKLTREGSVKLLQQYAQFLRANRAPTHRRSGKTAMGWTLKRTAQCARQIESRLRKPRGWLDEEHEENALRWPRRLACCAASALPRHSCQWYEVPTPVREVTARRDRRNLSISA